MVRIGIGVDNGVRASVVSGLTARTKVIVQPGGLAEGDAGLGHGGEVVNSVIRFALRSNWYAVIAAAFTVLVLGDPADAVDPDRHIADQPEPRGAGPHVLRRHAGHRRRKGHHDPHGAAGRAEPPAPRSRSRGRSSGRASSAAITARTSTPTALTQVNSLVSAAIPTCRRGRCTGGVAVRPDQHDAGLPRRPRQRDRIGIDPLRHRGRYEVRKHDHGDPRRVRWWSTAASCGRCWRTTGPGDAGPQPGAARLMNAIDRFNVFLPTGDAKFGKIGLRPRLQLHVRAADADGDIPVKTVNGKTVYLKDVARPEDAAMIQTNIVRVNGRRGLHSGLPPARIRHARRRRGAPLEDPVDEVEADARRHRPQGRHGPVRLCAELDRESRRGRDSRPSLCFACDPAFPRRVADDVDRDLHDSDRRLLGPHLP